VLEPGLAGAMVCFDHACRPSDKIVRSTTVRLGESSHCVEAGGAVASLLSFVSSGSLQFLISDWIEVMP
jgi:hypothetical protein